MSFTIDITDAVTAFKKIPVFTKQFKSKVPIAIRTDNSRDLQLIPSNLSDFTVYGGLYRYVNLVYQPALSVDKLFAKTEFASKGNQGRLSISSRWYNPLQEKTAAVSLKLFAPSGKMIDSKQESSTNLSDSIILHSFIIDKPQLWSTENPQLYTVALAVTNKGQTCIQQEKIGFRKAEFLSKGPFILNGKRLLLRGTHRHEDAAGVGAALTEEMMRQEMILMKEMGVNFIRLGHYQQSRIILNLCDSLGILVWEEIPWCRGGLGGEIYQSQAKRMLTNMIEEHYNHTSIILWGLGNENDWPGDSPAYDSTAVRSFMQQLNTLAHQLDNSRLTTIRRCDFCRDIPDVYSPSIWAGWYRGAYTDYKAFTQTELNRVDRLFHAEWGGDSHAGRHAELPDSLLENILNQQPENSTLRIDSTVIAAAVKASKSTDWNESYICNLMDWHLKEQLTMPWLSGSAQWAFRDFATPIRPDNPVPYVNQKGVVERDLTPKESYYVFQSYWATKPMAHIYGHSWPVRWGNEEEQKLVKVYSNCSEAELFINGKSLGVKSRNPANFPSAGLYWHTLFVQGKNKLKLIARSGKQTIIDSVSFDYETRKWSKPVKLLLEKVIAENDTATVQVKLIDSNGITCLDAFAWLRFGLAGDGKLVDNQGTSSGSRYVQAYNGRATIKIKLNKGESVVSVQSSELPTAFLSL